MRTLQACAGAVLMMLLPSTGYAQCADPPLSPRGRCIKHNGGTCNVDRKVWVAPHDGVRRKCAPLSDRADKS
jgi:hypothetical protein